MHQRRLTEIEIAEEQALASPRDYPEDFRHPHGWNACVKCLHYFLAAPWRTVCRECIERSKPCST